MLIGMPISFSLGLSSIVYMLWSGIPPVSFVQHLAKGVNSYTLLALPFFILAGQLMNHGGITAKIFRFTNAITEPKQVLKGGYLSWLDSNTGTWWQRSWFGAKPVDRALRNFKARNGNLREALDRYRELERAKVMGRTETAAQRKAAGVRPIAEMAQSPGRAAMLRATIRAVTAKK